ncbi:hypothetical protein [Roseomonas sp. HF4]|uniref:hypothetical protein n=1 Tax=Roseomonas sp. HF4 TaxID=2562313 RepID=UPI0010C1488A|nr:hypothetical protein [Roseomonas sp. HF4]
MRDLMRFVARQLDRLAYYASRAALKAAQQPRSLGFWGGCKLYDLRPHAIVLCGIGVARCVKPVGYRIGVIYGAGRRAARLDAMPVEQTEELLRYAALNASRQSSAALLREPGATAAAIRTRPAQHGRGAAAPPAARRLAAPRARADGRRSVTARYAAACSSVGATSCSVTRRMSRG